MASACSIVTPSASFTILEEVRLVALVRQHERGATGVERVGHIEHVVAGDDVDLGGIGLDLTGGALRWCVVAMVCAAFASS